MLHCNTLIGQNQCGIINFSHWYAYVRTSHTSAIGSAYVINKFCVYELCSLAGLIQDYSIITSMADLYILMIIDLIST